MFAAFLHIANFILESFTGHFSVKQGINSKHTYLEANPIKMDETCFWLKWLEIRYMSLTVLKLELKLSF